MQIRGAFVQSYSKLQSYFLLNSPEKDILLKHHTFRHILYFSYILHIFQVFKYYFLLQQNVFDKNI